MCIFGGTTSSPLPLVYFVFHWASLVTNGEIWLFYLWFDFCLASSALDSELHFLHQFLGGQFLGLFIVVCGALITFAALGGYSEPCVNSDSVLRLRQFFRRHILHFDLFAQATSCLHPLVYEIAAIAAPFLIVCFVRRFFLPSLSDVSRFTFRESPRRWAPSTRAV